MYYVGVRDSVFDISGSGHHGTPVNGIHEVTPEASALHDNLGNSAIFTGTEVITCPAMTAETGTIFVWFKTSTAGVMDLVTSTGIAFVINNGVVELTVNGNTVSDGTGLNDGGWHMAVGKYGVGGLSVSIDDGVAQSNPYAGTLAETADDWIIGNSYIGEMQEVSIHNVQVDAAEGNPGGKVLVFDGL